MIMYLGVCLSLFAMQVIRSLFKVESMYDELNKVKYNLPIYKTIRNNGHLGARCDERAGRTT